MPAGDAGGKTALVPVLRRGACDVELLGPEQGDLEPEAGGGVFRAAGQDVQASDAARHSRAYIF